MLIIIISRSSLKLGHVGLKTRSLDQQATQVSDLGPLWPSCFQKDDFFHEIFQVGACPNLKDSSIYEIFSIHMYRTYRVRYLQLFALSATS